MRWSFSVIVCVLNTSFNQLASAVIVPVRSAADFSGINASGITYELQNDIETDAIAFANAHNIRVTSTPGNIFTIKATSEKVNLILVESSSNIQIDHVNFKYLALDANAPSPCPQMSILNPKSTVNMAYVGCCGVIHIVDSANVLVTNGVIFGRISGVLSYNLTFENLDVSSNYTADGIDIMANGNVTNPGEVTVRNNNIHETKNGLTIRSIGVTVSNNMFDGFVFTAVQVDIGVHNTCASGFVVVENNYIRRLKGVPTIPDGAAIYVDTHWASAGNIYKNNFFWNEDPTDTRPLIYLDWVTSNQLVQNNIGLNMGASFTFKINTGHFNTISDNVAVNVHHAGQIGCENGGTGDRNNCANTIGQFWFTNAMAQPDYVKLIPWFPDVCNAKEYNGISCTTSSEQDQAYGGCSGVPHGNNLSLIISGNLTAPLPPTLPAALDQGLICPEGTTNADRLNSYTHEIFAGEVFSVLPTRTSGPVLSPEFIKAYPAFANFIAQLGPNDQALSLPVIAESLPVIAEIPTVLETVASTSSLPSSTGLRNVTPTSASSKGLTETTYQPSTTTVSPLIDANGSSLSAPVPSMRTVYTTKLEHHKHTHSRSSSAAATAYANNCGSGL